MYAHCSAQASLPTLIGDALPGHFFSLDWTLNVSDSSNFEFLYSICLASLVVLQLISNQAYSIFFRVTTSTLPFLCCVVYWLLTVGFWSFVFLHSMDCLIFFVGLCVLVGILAKLTLNKVVKQFARLECIILFCGVAGGLGIGLHAIPSPIGET